MKIGQQRGMSQISEKQRIGYANAIAIIPERITIN